MSYELDFEAPVAQLTGELERLQRSDGHEDQIDAIERDIEQQLRELYEDLTPWDCPGCPPPAAALHARLREARVHRFRRAPR